MHGKQAAGDAGHKCGEHKGIHLGVVNVDAHRFRGYLIIAHGEDGAAVRRGQEVYSHQDSEDHKERDPKKKHHRVVAQADIETGHVLHAGGASGQLIQVHQHDADDLAKAQGNNRQVVAAQSQGRQADKQADQRREQCPGHHRRQCRPAALEQDSRHISADRHESGVAEHQLAGHAGHEIEAKRYDHVDAGCREDLGRIAVDQSGPDQNSQNEVDHGDKDNLLDQAPEKTALD